MGYRSKVIVGVKKGKLSDQFDEILKKHDFKIDNPDGDYLIIEKMDEYKTYTFDYIKWYHDDEWCREIMLFLGENAYNDFRMKDEDVFCLGMGEDGNLHSEIGDYYEYINTIRDIELITN
jgi:hypothetical protein